MIESCFARAVNTKAHHNTSSRRSRSRLCNRLPSRTHNHVQLRRHRLTAHEHCVAREFAFCAWREVVGVAAAWRADQP